MEFNCSNASAEEGQNYRGGRYYTQVPCFGPRFVYRTRGVAFRAWKKQLLLFSSEPRGLWKDLCFAFRLESDAFRKQIADVRVVAHRAKPHLEAGECNSCETLGSVSAQRTFVDRPILSSAPERVANKLHGAIETRIGARVTRYPHPMQSFTPPVQACGGRATLVEATAGLAAITANKVRQGCRTVDRKASSTRRDETRRGVAQRGNGIC